jgi:hypothetical protein
MGFSSKSLIRFIARKVAAGYHRRENVGRRQRQEAVFLATVMMKSKQ